MALYPKSQDLNTFEVEAESIVFLLFFLSALSCRPSRAKSACLLIA